MWAVVVALLLAFVMPVMAYVPLARASHGAALANVPRHAANRPAVRMSADKLQCRKCTVPPSDGQEMMTRSSSLWVAPSASVSAGSSGKDGKKSGGCCPCCPSDCTCCDSGCQCHA